VFPVRYELTSYILLRRKSVIKGLMSWNEYVGRNGTKPQSGQPVSRRDMNPRPSEHKTGVGIQRLVLPTSRGVFRHG
jgi:hypothetical protein